jgi:hypothetical protein
VPAANSFSLDPSSRNHKPPEMQKMKFLLAILITLGLEFGVKAKATSNQKYLESGNFWPIDHFGTENFGTENFGKSHFGTDVSSPEHFGTCTVRHCGRSGRWTFQHWNFSTWGIFSTGKFRHEEFSAPEHFGTGIFWHLAKKYGRFGKDIWHLCYCAEMSMC